MAEATSAKKEENVEEITDPRMQALSALAAICQEYVNVLGQSGKQVSANLIIQSANQSVQLLKESIEKSS